MSLQGVHFAPKRWPPGPRRAAMVGCPGDGGSGTDSPYLDHLAWVSRVVYWALTPWSSNVFGVCTQYVSVEKPPAGVRIRLLRLAPKALKPALFGSAPVGCSPVVVHFPCRDSKTPAAENQAGGTRSQRPAWDGVNLGLRVP